MAKDLFNSLDLNLLRTFLVIHQEKNTRKAADRLFVSQPAVSQALQKLRHHFNDDLFIKVHGGLEATIFSNTLFDEITPHLNGLMAALNNTYDFDPKDIDFALKIALSPIVLNCLSGTLYQEIKQQAPNAQLELVSWSTNSVNEIKKGEVLIGVSYQLPEVTKEVHTKELVKLTGRIFVRKEHPLKKQTISPEDMAGYEMASLITPGWNDSFSYASRILDKHSVEHKVAFRSELILALIDVIQHTDMYMPHSNLFPIENYPSLRAIDIRINNQPPLVPLFSYIHAKHKNNPLTGWLFNILQKALMVQINK